ncbi:hypothetical protein GALMADRAFT_282558 [Galerina marginata CBS 339.88]|uniref:Uncharacterized protein n=1 Tax=Galerina marginata (strain CBS 339.88) TaxID=685588 RepID=A0A067SIT9_GALM3|nr:hypothetical protein GALMADRAFT_282558 [Galerina marginata CBS 339.88]
MMFENVTFGDKTSTRSHNFIGEEKDEQRRRRPEASQMLMVITVRLTREIFNFETDAEGTWNQIVIRCMWAESFNSMPKMSEWMIGWGVLVARHLSYVMKAGRSSSSGGGPWSFGQVHPDARRRLALGRIRLLKSPEWDGTDYDIGRQGTSLKELPEILKLQIKRLRMQG